MLRIREDRQRLARRIEVSRVAVGAVLSLLAIAYWFVQIVRGDYYFSLSENNRIRAVKVTAPRGYVLDRNGAVLVENEPAYTLHLYRREARDLAASIDFIVNLLGLDREQVTSRVERGKRGPEFVPIPIAENLGIEEVAMVEARAIDHPEFAITVSQRRLYRHGGAAAHALGYLSEATPEQIKGSSGIYQVGDWIGQKGIEGAYQRLLAGANGERRVIVDSHGREVAEANRLEATPGQNLFLTIDLKLQKVAEEYFRDRVGAVVAMDPRTGEILALVSSPSYDPNWFTRRVTSTEWTGLIENPDRPLQNRAVQNMYSPGSVFKVFLAYGALAQGLVDPSARVFCPGYATYYGREFRCHKKGGHGWVDLRRAIQVSCDVYFYNLGRQLGIDKISEIATAFGFGQPTGVDLAFEKSGLVPSEEWARVKRGSRWYPGRDDLGLDRPGAAARDRAAGGAGSRRSARRRTASDAAPLLRLAGSADGRAAPLQDGVPGGPRDLAREARGRQGRHVGGRERGRRHGVRLARAGRGDGRQDRHGPGRGPRDRDPRRGRPGPAAGPRVVRGLRPRERSDDGRRRVRGARRPRQPRRGAAREGALRGEVRHRGAHAASAVALAPTRTRTPGIAPAALRRGEPR